LKAIINKILEYFSSRTIPEYTEFPKWERGLVHLQKKINYSFHDITLLKAALTHKSYLRKKFNDHKVPSPFERMEFLGDSILGFIVSKELFQYYPDDQEGILSKLKSKIVSETYLTLKANTLELGKYILLSSEEQQSGGQSKPSILSDTMEAIICAVYLDGGISAAARFIKHYILTEFENLVNRIELVNYKSILQEHLQAKNLSTPEYITIDEEGPQHQKVFIVDVVVDGKKLGRGKGSTKKAAHQEAARLACQKLGI
jgi:ribonuclease III